MGQAAGLAGAAAVMGVGRWGIWAEQTEPPKAGLLPGLCVRGGVHPSVGLAELRVTEAQFVLVCLAPIFPRMVLHATGWTLVVCINSLHHLSA